jgi:hypothetical protein
MRPPARPQVYVDESGDAPIAPDIVSVVVTNDDAGLLTLGVSFANRTGLLPCDVLVVGLDVDRDKRTGGPMGMDYALSATTAAAELGVWSSSSWSGSGYVPIPGAASFSLSDHSVALSTSVDQLGALMALQRPQLRFVVIALASTDRPEQNWTDDVAGPWTHRLRPPTKARASRASRARPCRRSAALAIDKGLPRFGGKATRTSGVVGVLSDEVLRFRGERVGRRTVALRLSTTLARRRCLLGKQICGLDLLGRIGAAWRPPPLAARPRRQRVLLRTPERLLATRTPTGSERPRLAFVR